MAGLENVSRRNKAVVFRILEEEEAEPASSESDISEDDLDEVIKEINHFADCNEITRGTNKDAATSGHEKPPSKISSTLTSDASLRKIHRPSLSTSVSPGLHIVLAIDASASMARCDVVRKNMLGAQGMWDGDHWVPGYSQVDVHVTRLDAVLKACQDFMSSLSRATSKEEGVKGVYSLVSFNRMASLRCARVTAQSMTECLKTVQIKAWRETRFREAFVEIQKLLMDAPVDFQLEDVRVVLLSDGRPHEVDRFDALREQVRGIRQSLNGRMVLYTVGFGTDVDGFDLYLKPLSDSTCGTFNIATLNLLELSRVFTAISSTITSSRSSTEWNVLGPESYDMPFDPDVAGNNCLVLAHSVSQLKKTGRNKMSKRESFKILEKKGSTELQVHQRPFASGGMRVVHLMQDLSEQHESMVLKVLLGNANAALEDMLPFCRCTAAAISLCNSFQDTLKGRDNTLKIYVVPCYLYKYDTDDGEAYVVGEQRLEGEWVKFNNNDGYVNEKHPDSERMQAFSHFSYVKSRGMYMLVDLQGVKDENLGFLLTDPQVLTRANEKDSSYGRGDLGLDGIKKFFGTHVCGRTCELLNLKGAMKDLVDELDLEHRRCVICFDAPRRTVLDPCGHNLMCKICVLKMMEAGRGCPSCRQVINGFDEGQSSKTFVPPTERPRIRKKKRRW